MGPLGQIVCIFLCITAELIEYENSVVKIIKVKIIVTLGSKDTVVLKTYFTYILFLIATRKRLQS